MPWHHQGGAITLGGDNVQINPADHFLGTQNAAALRIHTENGGGDPKPATEAIRITAAAQGRRVGIGTTVPQRKLHVEPSEIHSGGNGAGLSFGNRQTPGFVEAPGNGERWVWYATGGTARLWSGTDKLSVTPAGHLDVNGSLEVGTNPIRFTSSWSAFPDNATNQAEICNDTGTFRTLMIVGNRSANQGPGLRRKVSVWDFLEVNGDLNVTGTARKPGGGPWSATSDRRLKKDVKPLTGALDKLLQLRGVSFEWKKPEEQGNLSGPQMGLIAQEVEEVLPEWVDLDPSGYKNLTVRGFEALAIEAFKELKVENETLKTRNVELEDRIKVLEKNIAERANDRGPRTSVGAATTNGSA